MQDPASLTTHPFRTPAPMPTPRPPTPFTRSQWTALGVALAGLLPLWLGGAWRLLFGIGLRFVGPVSFNNPEALAIETAQRARSQAAFDWLVSWPGLVILIVSSIAFWGLASRTFTSQDQGTRTRKKTASCLAVFFSSALAAVLWCANHVSMGTELGCEYACRMGAAVNELAAGFLLFWASGLTVGLVIECACGLSLRNDRGNGP